METTTSSSVSDFDRNPNSNSNSSSSPHTSNSTAFGVNLSPLRVFRYPLSTFLEYSGLLRVRPENPETDLLLPDNPTPNSSESTTSSNGEVSIRIIGSGENDRVRTDDGSVMAFSIFSLSQIIKHLAFVLKILHFPTIFSAPKPQEISLLEMGFLKEDRKTKVLRWVKTLFFLISMLISLLLFSAPILIVIADTLLPSLLLSASISPSSLSIQSLSSHLSNYDFRYSLVDIPLISIVRSVIILCVYSLCDGPRLSRGPYLGIATICSVSSLVFVSLKASYVFAHSSSMDRGGYVRVMEMALFVCSLALAVAHVVVAYRISCRERRKLLVYKIDIEAVSALKTGSFYRYLKVTPFRKTEVKLKSTESIST